MNMTKADEVAQVMRNEPHVVILGAGASIAATSPPFKAEKTGRKLPAMVDFVKTLQLEDMLDKANISYIGRNFEEIYDEISQDEKLNPVRMNLENVVYSYFSNMQLSDEPTAYDHLVMSLRGKDVIATFNWDPFLIQALRRNQSSQLELPTLLFLHGNVSVGHCEKDGVFGINGHRCPRCGNVFTKSKLLYPIRNKNYVSDFYISYQWQKLQEALQSALMVSIFGYGAPESDTGAKDLMKLAWGGSVRRNMEQFEIIDKITNRDIDTSRLHSRWSDFIHSHHYEVHASLNDSWIGKHPRRTIEAYWNQNMEIQYLENNRCPDFPTLEETWDWYKQFKLAEETAADEKR